MKKELKLNKDLANIFYSIADILELENVEWKPRAYRKAAQTLEKLDYSVVKLKTIKELEKLDGVGEGIAKKIIEYIKTGKIKEFEKLKKKEPKGITELLEIPGMGPKKAELFFRTLGIRSLSQLKKAIASGKLKDLPSIKEKTLENIKKGIERYEHGIKRHPYAKIKKIADDIVKDLRKNKNVDQAIVAGSIRRKEKTIRDIDILVTMKNHSQEKAKNIMDYFCKLDVVDQVLSKGITRSSVLIKYKNIEVDLRVVEKASYGSALLYFTGNKQHNIELRKIAKSKGMKLSEYGLFKGNKMVAGKTEKEIYSKLGLKYIDPTKRSVKK